MKLIDKVAIVTGSARGIGRGIALKFASEGASVVVADILFEQAQQVVDEIKNQGGRAIAFEVNVADRTDVASLCKNTLENFQTIHILVNNAGLIPSGVSLLKMTDEQWDNVLNVNLRSVYLCTQGVLGHMMEQQYGKIVNISSIGGIGFVVPGYAHYETAKAGIVMLTKATAMEGGPYGINVNAIAPGHTIHERHYKELGEEGMKKVIEEKTKSIPLGRLGKPEDIANLASFLASDDSSYITGQVICCNGGLVSG